MRMNGLPENTTFLFRMIWFVKKFFEGLTLADFAVWVSMLLILTAIFFLVPAEIRVLLQLNKDNFFVWQLFTAAFVHGNFEHLLDNVISFAFVFGLELAIVAKMPDLRIRFYKIFAITLLVVPLTTNTVDFLFSPSNTTLGFSAVSSAIYGLLFFVIICFINKDLDKKIDYQKIYWALLVYLLLLLVITVFVSPLVAAITVNLAAVAILTKKYNLKPRKIWNYFKQDPYRIQFLTLAAVLILGLSVMFQLQFAEGYSVNYKAHCLGACIGIILPVIIEK